MIGYAFWEKEGRVWGGSGDVKLVVYQFVLEREERGMNSVARTILTQVRLALASHQYKPWKKKKDKKRANSKKL